MTYININGNQIGPGRPTYIIAELSCNHNQSLDTAIRLIHEAANIGVDAIKIQTYTPDTITLNCNDDCFQFKGTIWKGKTLYELYQKAYTPWEWIPKLKREANFFGMDFFSSPFDTTAVDYLEQVGVPCYKVASFEIVDHILLKRIAETHKPVIVSTGMATLDDIESAIQVLKRHNSGQIALLKCTSAYPAKLEDANLATMVNLRDTFGTVVGLSDHTLGIEVPIASVTLGGHIIEKHLTLSRESGSLDDAFSSTVDEFREMIDAVRKTEKIMGLVKYGGVSAEDECKQIRRSLFIVQDIQKNEVFTEKNVRSIRPGDGLHTKYYDIVLGKFARQDIKRGTPLDWHLID